MLNKNQSRKINLWKYSIVLPALLIFILQFQVNVLAQTKGPARTSYDTKLSKIEMHVDAASEEKELNDMVAFFKDEFGAALKFSAYKKNNLNQIIGLKVTLVNKDGITKQYEVSGKTPIDTFTIFIDIDPDGRENFGFSNVSKRGRDTKSSPINQWAVVDSILISHSNQKGAQITATNQFSGNDPGNASDKAHLLYIINGKDYYPEMIQNQVITTSEYIEQLLPEEGLKRYGGKGKNGVLIFHGTSTFNQKGPAQLNKVSSPTIITLENGNDAVFFSDTKMKVPGFASVDFADSALELFINDVKYYNPKETMEGLDLGKIKSIEVVEPLNPETATKAHVKVLIQLK